jgi:hypothetical protein
MEDKPQRLSERFPLRLPPDLDAEVRKLARGDGRRPPAGINDTILFLIREGLKKVQADKESGNSVALDQAA